MSVLPIRAPSSVARRLRRGRAAIVAGALIVAGVLLLAGGRADRGDPDRTENRLVHWQDSQHDWLLVADRATHRLVVYDAGTGEPVRHLGVDNGLGEVDSIAQLGDLLLVQDIRGRSTLLGMPGLRPRALAAR